MHPIRELLTFLGESADYVRSVRRYDELVTIEPAQAIASDVEARERLIAEASYKSEINAGEALKAFEGALRPESEGGQGITKAEERRIRHLIQHAAAFGHDAAELATVS